jgi:hypothetical protein
VSFARASSGTETSEPESFHTYASAMLATVDAYTERRRDGTYGNIQEANNAVNCLDVPTPPYADLRSQASRFSTASPTFGLATLTSSLVCAHWPVHTTKGPPPRAAGSAPILVVGTTGDPATPYPWAEALTSYLESAVLLTYEGEGHTAYGCGVRCIDDAVHAYLLKGSLPAKGTRCGSGAPTSLRAWCELQRSAEIPRVSCIE